MHLFLLHKKYCTTERAVFFVYLKAGQLLFTILVQHLHILQHGMMS